MANKVMKYRKKPVVIEAIKWIGNNLNEIVLFTGQHNLECGGNKLKIKTLEGNMIASLGDYIIKGLQGEFYSCKPDIFNKTYEIIQERNIMERQLIEVQYPVLDHTESVANISIVKTKVNQGITIPGAFSNKNNSLFIVIENEAKAASVLTVKAGDAYPNSMLGDIVIELPAGTSAIRLQDLSRFEKADGSLDLDFEKDFKGSIFAVAQWGGVRN